VARDGKGEAGSRLLLSRPSGLDSTLTIYTPLLGTPGAYATLAAVAATEVLLGAPVTTAEVERALARVAASGDGRLTLRKTADGVLWIDDCYNANPPSMLAGLETAAEIATARRARLVLVLGEMRELGELGEGEHQRIAQRLTRLDHAYLIGVAGLAEHYLAGGLPGRVRFVPSAADAAPLLKSELRAGDVVLLKGSRGVGLEQIFSLLYPAFPKESSHV
jgi:UDP-N-acetylmuramoyl-tripeptide--D-alanyl-D-alanine ligase